MHSQTEAFDRIANKENTQKDVLTTTLDNCSNEKVSSVSEVIEFDVNTNAV